jgi:hypothetical protein
MTATPTPAANTVLASDVHVLGALALELTAGADIARSALPQGDAGALAGLIAQDLANFAPEAAALDLITLGAHYDPVEVLRPGWPLHHELDQLAARAPRSGGFDTHGGRIIAFGMHEGQLPGDLTPSPDYAGGPLRLVPFVLSGDAGVVARVGDAFESGLLEHGMASAESALEAQVAFGVRVEHARYLTVHDLAAMMALQYEHAGLGSLWPLLETALLQPDGEDWLDAPPEPLLHYAEGEARIALFEPNAWKARYATDADCGDPQVREQLAWQHERFEARQRQIAAVLRAHGVAVTFVHCPSGGDARVLLQG